MTTRKRNEWLDAGDSDEDDRGYNSEEESRAHILGGSKRMKLAHDTDEEEDDNAAGDEDAEEAFDENGLEELEDEEEGEDVDEDEESLSALTPQTKVLSKKLLSSKPKKDKSGLIYLSRVPPFMKPQVVRKYLSPYGAIGRIFLQPEDPSSRTARLRHGGSRRKLFLDGWVEFQHKRDAKFVAENLNAQTIGGKKRSRYHDEVWNIRYLSGVKWSKLTEQIANENAERAARMRAEIAQSKRENKMFVDNVERAKMLEGMERKEKGKRTKFGEDGGIGIDDEGGVAVESKVRNKGPRFTFKQNEVKLKGSKKAEGGQEVQRVLSKIF